MMCIKALPATQCGSSSDIQTEDREGLAFASLLEDLVSGEHRHGELVTGPQANTSSFPVNTDPPLTEDANKSIRLRDAAHSEQTTTECSDKRERAKELNRLKQAKYRKRCQEQKSIVLKQLETARVQLERSVQKWRSLRQERKELTERLQSLSVTVVTPTAIASVDSVHAQGGNSTFTASIPSLPSRIIAAKPRETGWNWFDHQRDESHDLPAAHKFTHHLVVSYSRVLQYIPKPQQTVYDFSILSMALNSYQSALTLKCGASLSDICWFHEWQSHNGFKFATSLPARSPECCLSASLAVISTGAECLFLTLQHAELEDSNEGGNLTPQDRQNAEKPLSLPPLPADPSSLTSLMIRCSPQVTCPIQEAVNQVIKPLFRKYRSVLPRERWRRACLQCIASLQASMPKGRPSANSVQADRAQPGSGMDWSLLEAGQVALMQLVILAIFTSLSEPCPDDSRGEQQSLEAVRGRMRSVLCDMSLATRVAIRCNAPIFCRIVFQQHLEKCKDSVKAERMTRRVYRQLRLSSDQKEALAVRWHSWRRRRTAKSQELMSAIHHLSRTLLPTTFLLQFQPLISFFLDCHPHSRVALPPFSPAPSCHLSLRPATPSINPSPSPSPAPPTSHLQPDPTRYQDHQATPQRDQDASHHHMGFAHVRVDPRGAIPWDGLLIEQKVSTISNQACSDHTDRLGYSCGSGSQSGSCNPPTTPSPGLTQGHPIHVNEKIHHNTGPGTMGSERQGFLCEREIQFLCDAENDGSDRLPRQSFRPESHAIESCSTEGMRAAKIGALGQNAALVTATQAAMHDLKSVHESDSLMHEEFVGLYSELTEVQHAILFAAHMQHGMRVRDVMEIMQIASQDLVHEKLFGKLEHLSL